MTGPDIAAIVLLVTVSLLAAVAGTLVILLFLRRTRPQVATPLPLPRAQGRRRGVSYRSLTPSSLPRPPVHRPAWQRRAGQSGAAAVLTVHSGPLRAARFPLARPTFALGRSSLCDITIPDPQASRQHARLEWHHDGLYMVDTNSTNGTYVNGYRVGQVRLRGGEWVQIGDTTFRVQLY